MNSLHRSPSERRPLLSRLSEHMNLCTWALAKVADYPTIGSSPTAPQTNLSDILQFYELYVKTGQGRVRNRKVREAMVEEPKVKSSKPIPCILIGTHGNTKQWNEKTGLRLIMLLRALRGPNPNSRGATILTNMGL